MRKGNGACQLRMKNALRLVSVSLEFQKSVKIVHCLNGFCDALSCNKENILSR